MKQMRMLCLLAALSLAMGIVSRGQGAAPAAKPATPAPQAQASPQPAQPAPTFASMVDRQVSAIEKQFVEAAEAMPEDKFNFSPESLNIQGSDYKGVRTFALEVKHVATANYAFWTGLTGDKMPEGIKGPNGPEELKTKAEIVKFLKDSFAYVHKAIASMNEQNATESLKSPWGQNTITRLGITTLTVAHIFDHYGQMVVYLRHNGIVPPASKG